MEKRPLSRRRESTLRVWAAQYQEYKHRPKGVTKAMWCKVHGINVYTFEDHVKSLRKAGMLDYKPGDNEVYAEESYWIDIIQRCSARPYGMTVAQWCEQNDIVMHTYYQYYKKYKDYCEIDRRYRKYDWVDIIKRCCSRPAGVSVKKWCEQNDVERVQYYRHLREYKLTVQASGVVNTDSKSADSALELVANGVNIRVTDQTSPELLEKILKIINEA